MKNRSGPTMADLSAALEREFNQWDYIHEHGSNDPFYADGMGLNLTRNHIIYGKHQMEELLKQEDEEPTLFRTQLPDIYYRATPEEVSYDFMAKPDAIRSHAKEQLALYEQDPNFCFIRDHFHEIFPKGETKATRAAGLNYYATVGFSWYRRYIEKDDLVEMRMRFREPYEEKAKRWVEYAKSMKDFLSQDHSKEDMVPVRDEYEDEDICEGEEDLDIEGMDDTPAPTPERKISLNEQISQAAEKASEAKPLEPREEQITLF